MLNAVATHAPNRTVVITGDIHSNWVNELHDGFSRPDKRVVAAEFVGTSISSGGDGSDVNRATGPVGAENPHVKWQNSRRGYITCNVTPDAWTTEYRVVPFITRPDAPLQTPTRWRVTRTRPGIEAV